MATTGKPQAQTHQTRDRTQWQLHFFSQLLEEKTEPKKWVFFFNYQKRLIFKKA
jgi:hypothetical protein